MRYGLQKFFGLKTHVGGHRRVASPDDGSWSRRVERSLLWEITGSLAAAGNDLRVGKELLFSKPKIVVK